MLAQQIDLRPATRADESFVYDAKKQALGPYITEVFGWDEATQQHFHRDEYQQENSFIVLEIGHPIGWLAFHQEEDVVIIDHLYLLPEKHGNGIGTHLLTLVLNIADQHGHRVQLGVLKINPARRLYERCGFRIVTENMYFYHMEREPVLGQAMS
ncbi:hypothetical protein SE17_05980 [Kouleothrix aurantiaca]|uniref:N-acetyltransferase domain-containing protein n=1 Tax=Kouleothrix aurantiaca TaxID=186479 RepID=A0A0P9D4P3_9CHLR|nr:hypothetical protein SE17_05980 [Kouleothrix aurantiaca]